VRGTPCTRGDPFLSSSTVFNPLPVTSRPGKDTLPSENSRVYHPGSVTPHDWLARRTFHHEQFADTAALIDGKERQSLTVSVCIPTLNEAATIGPIVETIRRELVEGIPLVDELAVMDSSSGDGTAEAAERAGAVVHQDRDIRPDLAALSGKGEALWKSLFALHGDVILWLDADIVNFHPRFVCGPLGPLLTNPEIGYVKSFYERPMSEGTSLGGGRVTELVARPLLNMFWPHLSGLIQPLSGEYAGRRSILEQVPFLTGYGVEIGLIIDVADRFGIEVMAQVDLEDRIHRNRPIGELSRMAFAVLQSALRRLASSGRMTLAGRPGIELSQFEKEDGEYRVLRTPIDVGERPPAVTVGGYGTVR
jgi:Glycosyl transferase family 2